MLENFGEGDDQEVAVAKRKRLAGDVKSGELAIVLAKGCHELVAMLVGVAGMIDGGPPNLGQAQGHRKKQIAVAASNFQGFAGCASAEKRLREGDNARDTPNVRAKHPLCVEVEHFVGDFVLGVIAKFTQALPD